MRVLVVSILIFALNLAYWIQFYGLVGIADFNAGDPAVFKDFLLNALILYLIIEGGLLLRREHKSAQTLESKDSELASERLEHSARTELLNNKLEELQLKLREQKTELGRLNELLADASQKKEELKVANQELNTRLNNLSAGQSKNEDVQAGVVHFISLLQQKGRFIDFLMDDIAPYDNAQVGQVARVVHQGCAAVVREYFAIKPVHEGREGEKVELGQGFDPDKYRLVGKVVGNPPFKGVVLHRGWRTAEIKLPRINRSEQGAKAYQVITPAEVEL